jgi:hypothetical protein
LKVGNDEIDTAADYIDDLQSLIPALGFQGFKALSSKYLLDVRSDLRLVINHK